MTVEPYAFYFMGRNSSLTFSGITAAPSTLTSVVANSAKNYYYYSQNYMEANVYKSGIWCKYYYHIAIPPKFGSS